MLLKVGYSSQIFLRSRTRPPLPTASGSFFLRCNTSEYHPRDLTIPDREPHIGGGGKAALVRLSVQSRPAWTFRVVHHIGRSKIRTGGHPPNLNFFKTAFSFFELDMTSPG